MANPYHHSVSSAKKYGGKPEDYMYIHEWFDESKNHFGDLRHRALRHHSEGIKECCEYLGDAANHCFYNSDRKYLPVRWIAEQHVIEDLGFIPSVKDWLVELQIKPWMTRSEPLSQIQEKENDSEIQRVLD